MSYVFSEALERASNPKMPPPKSPARTPTSPPRTSSMFQGKIKETVITIPGMQNAIFHLQIHPKSSHPVPAKSNPSIDTLITDQALHPVQNPDPQPPGPTWAKAMTSTLAARSHHSLFSHLKPQLQLPPDSLTRSRSQNSRHPATCPTRPTTPKTKSTGQSSLRLCLHRILTAAPAAVSETHRRPRMKKELGTSCSTGSTGSGGCRSSSRLLTHCVTRGHYQTRPAWKRNTIL
jgi:hypothetical protein